MQFGDSKIVVTETVSPIITVTFRQNPGFEEYTEYLGHMSQMLVRRTDRVALVFDSRDSGAADARTRNLQGAWLKEKREQIARRCAGIAFVAPSVIQRGAMTAIFWIQPLPAPHAIVATEGEARAWAVLRLAQDARAAESSALTS